MIIINILLNQLWPLERNHVPEISDFLFEPLKNANRKISFVSYFIFDDASKGKMLHKTFCSLVCFVQNSYSG